jgi:arginyl-tRNA synthetase
MIEEIRASVLESLEAIKEELALEVPSVPIEITVPKKPEFGDYSTNVALLISGSLKMSPKEVASLIVARLPIARRGLFNRIEVKGAGFINFYVNEEVIASRLADIEREGEGYGKSNIGGGVKVLVEYVSANPTGFLHMGHARNAAVGDAIANILEASGYDVKREFYINDSGRQIEMLGVSVLARYKESFGIAAEIPEDGYFGDYIGDIAQEIKSKVGSKFVEPQADEEEALSFCKDFAVDYLLRHIRETLESFGVVFDNWYSETENILSPRKEEGLDVSLVEFVKEMLISAGATYEADNALWFRAREYGDSQDWVIVKSDGSNTYFLNDIAYHYDKIRRGFGRLINVWGADHHGHVARLRAALRALNFDPSLLEVVLIQFVRLIREGEEVKMSKRAGRYVTMDDVIREVGADVTRFFLLMRSSDSHLDFDLDLAKRESSENPVFYIQYANARIASVFEKASGQGLSPSSENLGKLSLPIEIALIKKLLAFPDVVRESAQLLAPHKLVFYLQDIASDFHVYYNKVRIIGNDRELSEARLFLAGCIKKVIGNGLRLLGVSVPERM